MFTEIIEKISNNINLSFEEACYSMEKIISGEINNSLIAAFLISLKIKKIQPIEIAGFIKAMKAKSIQLSIPDSIDVCGTGGDHSNTFNISTAVSFITAAAGIKVAKHGNRSISSQSGSADVLKELGININLSKDQTEYAINNLGISFLFAPDYHPSLKNVMPVRRELGIRTVFNILGPLLNPANVDYQMIGVFDNETADLISESINYLNKKKVTIICNENKYDEIILDGMTRIILCENGDIIESYISNELFNYPRVPVTNITCKNPSESAEIIFDVFNGNLNNPYGYTIAANSAYALYSANYSNSLKECQKYAEDIILSKKAKLKLNDLAEYCRSIN